MNLPGEPFIAASKILKYLLLFQEEDDKSKFLNEGGYFLENWEDLFKDLIVYVAIQDAHYIRKTQFGDEYVIKGILPGRKKGKPRKVYTVWYYDKEEEISRFITLRPLKKREELK